MSRICHLPGRRVMPVSSVRAAVAALALAAVSAAITGCGDAPQAPAGGPSGQKKSPLVAVAQARKAGISRTLTLSGEAEAILSAVISSTVEGRISFCPWREGDRIESAGQRLIEIDRDVFRADVKVAEAAHGVALARFDDMKAGTRPEEIAKAREEVRQAEESAAFAKSDLERVARMAESGTIPAEAGEKARVENVARQARLESAKRHLEMLEAGATVTALAVQEALVGEAAAKVGLAKARLAECVISAPFAGTVTRVHSKPGDLAAMKAPLIAIADFTTMVLRAAVPESSAAMVSEGMNALVRLDSFPGKEFRGRVSRVFPDLDRRLRTRTAEITLPESPGLVPGMFARILLELESVMDAVVVPREALVAKPPGGLFVFVIENDRALQRKVTAGIEEGGLVQVASGLAPGETVVVMGNEKLKDGAEVRVMKPGGGQAKGGKAAEGMPGKAGSAPPGAGEGGGR